MPYLADATSLAKLFQLSCRHWGEKTAHIVLKGSTRTEISFREVYEASYQMARVLHKRGLTRGDMICVYSENCQEWAILDWACQTLGIVLVPVYPTLTGEQAQFIAEDCAAKLFVVGSAAHRDRVADLLKIPLVMLKGAEGSLESELGSGDLTKEQWEAEIDAAKMDDLATLIYTSGTTGNPKGAVLTHEAFAFLVKNVGQTLPVDHTDTFICWLPLAHVYERFAGHVLPTCIGATIGYAQSLASMAKDIQEIKPTIFLSVPRFLDSLREKIVDGVAKAPPIRQKLFALALSQGTKKVRGEFAPLFPLTDKLVGSKIRERTGGRLKFFVSGGAALPMGTYEFLGSFGILVLQGYGLTETCAASSFNPPTDNKPHSIGFPVHGLEMKIAEDGEILIRGKSVMKGYWNQPEATAECIDADGWFHTGDIGKMDGHHFQITDRKKDIIVLENGKNVAPQPIENMLRETRSIKEVVLFGDGQPLIAAMIMPDWAHLETDHGIKGDPATLLSDDRVRAVVKADVDSVNKRIADYEKVKRFELSDAEFSIETGELTPKMSIKRKVVKEKYSDLVKRLFREA